MPTSIVSYSKGDRGLGDESSYDFTRSSNFTPGLATAIDDSIQKRVEAKEVTVKWDAVMLSDLL